MGVISRLVLVLVLSQAGKVISLWLGIIIAVTNVFTLGFAMSLLEVGRLIVVPQVSNQVNPRVGGQRNRMLLEGTHIIIQVQLLGAKIGFVLEK